ncbi:hypothetical protein M3599_03780 [Niallia circulans]|uniref:hypothetical protein n=1 Tax=Niallia circulans TaxID=1397 RepID=UPI00203D645C|nr:hypothetical protein [Niallia circulans]MCM2980046.1 hypothetical protein [Niallia circulans]
MVVKPNKYFACYLLIFLHVFLGIGAFFGGILLIVSPSGSMLSMPLTILENSPFSNFLFPGIILFVGLGIMPIMTAIFLITEKPLRMAEKLSLYKEAHWAWNSSLYIGFNLIIWITVQLFIIQEAAVIHIFYLFLGMAIQLLTLLPSVKAYYSNN